MPSIRYWEVVRYYRYVGGVPSDWRAFEVRSVIALPDDWSQSRIESEKSRVARVLDSLFEGVIKEVFPQLILSGVDVRQRLIDIVTGDSDWGELSSKFNTITTGWEKSDKTEYISIERYTPLAIGPYEWRSLRGQLGALSAKRLGLVRRIPDARSVIDKAILNAEISSVDLQIANIRSQMEEVPSSVPESTPETGRDVEYTVIDKTGRYSKQFPKTVRRKPAYKGTFWWEIPFE